MIGIKLGAYKDVLQGFTADLILTSPPYNIGSKAPAKTGTRSAKTGTYDSKSYRGITDYADNMPEKQYQQSQVDFLLWATEHLTPNGVLVYNHKPRRVNSCLIHPMNWLLRVKDLILMEEIVWDRKSTHNHSVKLMWPHTERIYVLRKKGGKYPLDNRSTLPQRSDIWRVTRAKNNGHNAPFPLELAEAAILAWSKRGDLVMDPYSGSGTTAVACRGTHRNFIGAEIVHEYYKKSLERLQNDSSPA